MHALFFLKKGYLLIFASLSQFICYFLPQRLFLIFQ